MSYKVTWQRSAEKAAARLPNTIRERVLERCAELADDPRPRQSRKLKGSDVYRLRVGTYRVLYAIFEDDLEVQVLRVAHRREVYR